MMHRAVQSQTHLMHRTTMPAFASSTLRAQTHLLHRTTTPAFAGAVPSRLISTSLLRPFLAMAPRTKVFAATPRTLLQPRMLSTSSHAPHWTSHLTIANAKKFWPAIAAGSMALIAVYGLGSAMFHITTTFLSLDFKHVFYIGFITGTLGSACVAGGVYYIRKLVTISTQVVHRRAISKLARSRDIATALGPNVRSGELRAYTLHSGRFAWTGSKIAFVEPRAQMLFQVVGDMGEGMASVEAVKHKGGVVLTLLAVDTLATRDRPSELIVALGSEDKLHVRGTLRGFLQTERAQYIPQDKPVVTDVSELLAEQETLPEESDDDASSAASAAGSAPRT